MRRGASLTLLLALLVVVSFVSLWQRDTASAQSDLTGAWDIDYVGAPFDRSCPDVQITQVPNSATGNDIVIDTMGCWPVLFEGTFNKFSHQLLAGNCLAVPGGPLCVGMAGTATQDIMSGTVNSNFGYTGSFTGTRDSAVTPTQTASPIATPTATPLAIGGLGVEPNASTGERNVATSTIWLLPIAAVGALGVLAILGARRRRRSGGR